MLQSKAECVYKYNLAINYETTDFSVVSDTCI